MNVLIGIPVCHADDYRDCVVWLTDHPKNILDNRPSPESRRAAIRATWWNHLPYDHRFFFGTGDHEPLADEVILPVPDGFRHHCAKNQAMFAWALEHGYDYVYRADDDTFVYPQRLELASWELTGDQIGYLPHPEWSGNYITGGAGYWVSRKAMQVIVAAPITRTHEDDLWIGRLLKDTPDIKRVHDDRYRPGLDGDDGHSVIPERLDNNHTFIAVHSCSPDVMKALWLEWGTR